jgi:hypothetical protein
LWCSASARTVLSSLFCGATPRQKSVAVDVRALSALEPICAKLKPNLLVDGLTAFSASATRASVMELGVFAVVPDYYFSKGRALTHDH